MMIWTIALGAFDMLLISYQWSPLALGIVLALAVVRMVYRLRAERQRRITLDHVLERAPGGSVIIQDKGPAGPAMQIWVGEGPRPAPQRVQIIVPGPVVLPAPVGSDER